MEPYLTFGMENFDMTLESTRYDTLWIMYPPVTGTQRERERESMLELARTNTFGGG